MWSSTTGSGILLWVWGQLGLLSEFHSRFDCTVKPCLKNKTKETKKRERRRRRRRKRRGRREGKDFNLDIHQNTWCLPTRLLGCHSKPWPQIKSLILATIVAVRAFPLSSQNSLPGYVFMFIKCYLFIWYSFSVETLKSRDRSIGRKVEPRHREVRVVWVARFSQSVFRNPESDHAEV